MISPVILLSIPGLRRADLSRMPHLEKLLVSGEVVGLEPSFPCVTWPVQTSMLTGRTPDEHGITANGFYWRDQREVEMWTAWNERITAPQIWDQLHQKNAELSSAVWFPMLSKGCAADYVCMPAPIHRPDGSEELWCYTQPTELYGTFLEQLGHFPLQHFWGPMASIQSTTWIAESAILAAEQFQPRFFYVYLPHLDYAAQRTGPDSEAAVSALSELDDVIGRMIQGFHSALDGQSPLWLVASEYTIVPVDHVTYPNRLLRDAGLLKVQTKDGQELLDFEQSDAWALVDHQFSHVFVRDANPAVLKRTADIFQNRDGFAEVLVGSDRDRYAMSHPRSGEVILISTPNSWQAYYWWLDDRQAPEFAHSVDIHRKPGYDPVELHFDQTTRRIPLNASLVAGSHGAPARSSAQQGILAASKSGVLGDQDRIDRDVATIVLNQF